jgi:hypothetical protein
MIDSIKIEKFDSYENLDLGIRFIHPPSWKKLLEDESSVSFSSASPLQDRINPYFSISRVGNIDPLDGINQVLYNYNQKGYNTTDLQPMELINSPGSSGYFFNYSFMENTGLINYGYEVVVIQNNVTYEIIYEFVPEHYDSYVDHFQTASISAQYQDEAEKDYDSYLDEFSIVLDSAQIFEEKRYEKVFGNNSMGIILEYPSFFHISYLEIFRPIMFPLARLISLKTTLHMLMLSLIWNYAFFVTISQ